MGRLFGLRFFFRIQKHKATGLDATVSVKLIWVCVLWGHAGVEEMSCVQRLLYQAKRGTDGCPMFSKDGSVR